MNFSTKADQGNLVSRGSVRKEASDNKGRDTLNIKTVANLKNLISAYESIKSKPGNSTPGVDGITLDGISKGFLLKVQASLRAGKFTFPPARRILIPKPGKPGETRPLTIAAPRDKVVQKALLQVLESYFEPMFLESSHGFRPNRGTHTATRYLDAKFQSVRYIIEADFSKAFDSINHSKLMDLIAHHCTDEKLLKTINSGLKSGWMDEFGELHNNLEAGTPQGSILSPLLCNIFLHELDTFMEKAKAKHNVGEKHKRSKEYISLANKVK
jgi:group II intron reverse transcriptase/maturase